MKVQTLATKSSNHRMKVISLTVENSVIKVQGLKVEDGKRRMKEQVLAVENGE